MMLLQMKVARNGFPAAIAATGEEEEEDGGDDDDDDDDDVDDDDVDEASVWREEDVEGWNTRRETETNNNNI